jgi:hypothetical protein
MAGPVDVVCYPNAPRWRQFRCKLSLSMVHYPHVAPWRPRERAGDFLLALFPSGHGALIGSQ